MMRVGRILRDYSEACAINAQIDELKDEFTPLWDIYDDYTEYTPVWTLKSTYTWEAVFPAGETVGRVVAVLPSSRVLVLLAGGALMAAAVASPRVRRSGRRRRRS